MATMKAAVMYEPGGPEVLKLENIPVPEPKHNEILIRIKAFGLNRSELFTRQGHSPGVKLPRVLGIEACGVVEENPSGKYPKGTKVASVMGGLGRDINGGYAEFCCVHEDRVKAFETGLPWDVVGAAPEMLQTAYGSLFKALRLEKSDRLLVRGGTTSVGLAAAAIAKNHGCFVAGSSRKCNPETEKKMKESGMEQILIDDGKIAAQIKDQKFNKILELIGTTTLRDSLQCLAGHGICCMTGMVGNSWAFKDDFAPMDSVSARPYTPCLPTDPPERHYQPITASDMTFCLITDIQVWQIPSTACLTIYDGGPNEFQETPLNDLLKQIEKGTMKVQVGKVFRLDDIVEAHRTMEENRARGKIVVLP